MANILMGSAGSPELQPYPRTPEGQGCITDNDKYLKYKGVRKRKWGKWVSEVRLPNSRERIWLGSFDTPQKAARAFDAAQFCLRGRCARFNFPDDPPHIPGGESLSPHEIQVVAARFANEVEIRSTTIATDDDQHRQERDIIDHNNYNMVNTNENSSHVSSSNEEQSQNPNRYGQGHCYNDAAQGDMVTDSVTGWPSLSCFDESDGTSANNYDSFDPLFYDDQMSYISGHEFFNPAVPAPQDNDISREGYNYYSHINGDDESISQQQFSSFLWNF